MKRSLSTIMRITMIIVVLFVLVPSVDAKKGTDGGYQTGFVRWRAADNGFTDWTLSNGAILNGGTIQLNYASAVSGIDPYAAGGYYGGNYYNAGSFHVGEATSPEVLTGFNYQEAIASWNAATPPGSWVEVQFRAQYGTRWSKWYVLGIWASDTSTIQRHSVRLQGDSDGYVAVDTFVSSNKKEATDAFQLKFRLFSANGGVTPTVQNASVAYSTTAPKSASTSTGNPGNWDTLLNVPECSQMVYPGEGGEVWCSPTSTSMVLGYWNNVGTCDSRVHAAVNGVYDWIYDGHGNWPFNTAYAATQVSTKNDVTQNLEGYVARFTSLAKAEEFVNAGVPVIMSIAWAKGDLTNAYISSTNGHLLVLVGFDKDGNPIINDPAWPSDEDVQHMYLRSEFEHLWLEASGGTVYLIYPAGWVVPTP